MRINWNWFKKLARVEERLKIVSKTNLDLTGREERLQKELKRAVEKEEVKKSAPARGEAKKSALLEEQAKESTSPRGKAMSIFGFLNEDDTNPPNPLEMAQRASGKAE